MLGNNANVQQGGGAPLLVQYPGYNGADAPISPLKNTILLLADELKALWNWCDKSNIPKKVAFSALFSAFCNAIGTAFAFGKAMEAALELGGSGLADICKSLQNLNILVSVSESILEWLNDPSDDFRTTSEGIILTLMMANFLAQLKGNLPKLGTLLKEYYKEKAPSDHLNDIAQSLKLIEPELKRLDEIPNKKNWDIELRIPLAQLKAGMKNLEKALLRKGDIPRNWEELSYSNNLNDEIHDFYPLHKKMNHFMTGLATKNSHFLVHGLKSGVYKAGDFFIEAAFNMVPSAAAFFFFPIVSAASTLERTMRWFPSVIFPFITSGLVLASSALTQLTFIYDSFHMRALLRQASFSKKILAMSVCLALISFASGVIAEGNTLFKLLEDFLSPETSKEVTKYFLLLLGPIGIRTAMYTGRKVGPYLGMKFKEIEKLIAKIKFKMAYYRAEPGQPINVSYHDELFLLLPKEGSNIRDIKRIPLNNVYILQYVSENSANICWNKNGKVVINTIELTAELSSKFKNKNPTIINEWNLMSDILSKTKEKTSFPLKIVNLAGSGVTLFATTGRSTINSINIPGLVVAGFFKAFPNPGLFALMMITAAFFALCAFIFFSSFTITSARYNNTSSLDTTSQFVRNKTLLTAENAAQFMTETKEPLIVGTYPSISQSFDKNSNLFKPPRSALLQEFPLIAEEAQLPPELGNRNRFSSCSIS